MESECSFDGSGVRVKRKELGRKRASSDFRVKCGKRHRGAVRDFPNGCGPLGSTRRKNLCSSGPEEEFVVPCGQKKGLDVADQIEVLGNDLSEELCIAGPEKLSESKDSDATESPKNSTRMVAKICRPRRKISAIRCFPPGCGRRTSETYQEVAPNSTVLEAYVSYHGRGDALSESNGEAMNTTNQKNVGSTCKQNMFQQDCKCIGTNEGIANKSLDLKEKLCFEMEVPLRRVVVHALAASKEKDLKVPSQRVKVLCDFEVQSQKATVPFDGKVPAEMAIVPFVPKVPSQKVIVPFDLKVPPEKATVPFDAKVPSEKAIVSFDLKGPSQKVIVVQAIVASTECPWRQNKRATRKKATHPLH